VLDDQAAREQKGRLLTPDGRRISPGAVERGLRINIAAGSLGMIWVVALGLTTTLFMEALGASGVQIGLVVTVQQLAMAVQIPAAYFAERLVARKTYWATIGIIQRMLWFIPAVLPFVFASNRELAAWCMLGVVAASAVLMYMAAPSWFSWMADLVPDRLRGRFWGVRQSVSMAACLVGLVLTGWLLDRFSDAGGPGGGFKGYTLAFVLAAVAGTLEIVVHLWVPEPRSSGAHRDSRLLARIITPLRDRDFMWSTLAFGFWTFAIGLVGSFYLVYLRREFSVTYSQLTALSIAASIASVWSGPVWGRLMDAIGSRAFGGLMLLLLPLFLLVWFFVKAVDITLQLPLGVTLVVPQPILLLFVVNLVAGAFYSGVSLCQLSISTALAPREGRTMAMAVHWTLVGLIGAGGPIVGGAIMDHVTANPLPWRLPTGTPVGFHQVLVTLHIAVLWFVVLPLLMRIKRRPGEVPVSMLTGNPLRTVAMIQSIIQVGGATGSRLRAAAARKVGRGDAPVLVPTLVEQLDDPSTDVREEAALALGRVGAPEAVEALVRKLDDPESDLGPQIARALREARQPATLDPLVRQLASRDRETRVESARALGAIGDRRAGPPLMSLLRETDDPKVVSASSDALAQLGEIAAVYEILPRMKATRNPVLARSLAVAVGNLLGQEDDFYALLVAEQQEPASAVPTRLARIVRAARRRRPRRDPLPRRVVGLIDELDAAYDDERYADCTEKLFALAVCLRECERSPAGDGGRSRAEESAQRRGVGMWYLDLLRSHWSEANLGEPGRIGVLLGIHVVTCMVMRWDKRRGPATRSE
jgi:MFS family permease